MRRGEAEAEGENLRYKVNYAGFLFDSSSGLTIQRYFSMSRASHASHSLIITTALVSLSHSHTLRRSLLHYFISERCVSFHSFYVSISCTSSSSSLSLSLSQCVSFSLAYSCLSSRSFKKTLNEAKKKNGTAMMRGDKQSCHLVNNQSASCERDER